MTRKVFILKDLESISTEYQITGIFGFAAALFFFIWLWLFVMYIKFK